MALGLDALSARARELGSVRELRIVGPDTDLRVGVEGRSWIAADGHYNMPDGEVFTSPVETETEGEIRYTFPAVYHGREVEDVRLRFEGGRVVHAEASRGDDYLQSLLEMDQGARVLGEVAFGLNYEIDRFTRNILFDEKIGGTMHLALGSGFPQAGWPEHVGAALGHDLRPARRRRGLCRRRARLEGRPFPRRARAQGGRKHRAWLAASSGWRASSSTTRRG